ncbi:acetolactate synthase-like protein, partial [Manacus vitellinus]|uniref:acetolactate synthase-like protein n=1 Tax=Manacus vitellinus TaxID=328815 RepID=UPI00115E0D0C
MGTSSPPCAGPSPPPRAGPPGNPKNYPYGDIVLTLRGAIAAAQSGTPDNPKNNPYGDIVPTLRGAIAAAQSGTPGPVFVELPIDVLYPFHVVQRELGGARGPRGLRGKVVHWYLQNYLHNLFAGAWEPRAVTP